MTTKRTTKKNSVFTATDKLLKVTPNPLATLRDKQPSTLTDSEKDELAQYTRDWLREKLGDAGMTELEDLLAVTKWGGYSRAFKPLADAGTARRKAAQDKTKAQPAAVDSEALNKIIAEQVAAAVAQALASVGK